MKQNLTKWPLAAGLLALSGSAMAHTGVHGPGGLAGGLLHPLAGFDHLAVMFAVGVWAVAVLRERAWRPVLVFLGFMAVGALAGINGLALPALETGISASVLLMGLLLVALTRVSAVNGMMLIAAFALFHGNAHGLEMPVAAAPLRYAAGFLLTTAMLHLAGMWMGARLMAWRSAWIMRGMGIAVSGAGAWMLLGA